MSSNAHFWLSEIFSFSLFILILYLLIPFHFCEGNPTNRIVACTHVSVISCMFSWDDHVFHEISKIREFLFGIMRIMNIHWNKISSVSWPKVTCNMQNGPCVIDDARKYDVHWPALCLFPSGIYCFIQGVYKKTHKYYVHGNIGSSRIKFEYSNGLFLQIIIVHVIR